ncbi:MAG TPA: hypothetical protein VF183_15225, partial [Acidimicrobiales bacterium]
MFARRLTTGLCLVAALCAAGCGGDVVRDLEASGTTSTTASTTTTKPPRSTTTAAPSTTAAPTTTTAASPAPDAGAAPRAAAAKTGAAPAPPPPPPPPPRRPPNATPSSIGGCPLFPGSFWYADVSTLPRHPQSDAFVARVGADATVHPDFLAGLWEGGPIGMPYVVVPPDQPAVPITFHYQDESDPGPYPIPPDAPIEEGEHSNGDRHVIVV